MALGAAVGGAVMGRRAGVRAFAWGAVAGTLPDLDTFVPYASAVASFTYHRGVSHALFYQTVAAPLLAAGIARLHRQPFPGWLAAVWLVLVTHALLDSLTIYGTQLLLPFSDYPVGLGSIFIIDPLYTLPLLIGVGVALAWRRRRRARRWNLFGLVLSTAYLGWTVAAQQWVQHAGWESLADRGIEAQRLLATPTPFNSVLWRVLAVGESAYHEGFYRLGQGDPIRFHSYDSDPRLLTAIDGQWAVQRLRYFTKGYYAVNQYGERVVITDLRMGQHPFYAFRFQVGVMAGGAVMPAPDLRLPSPQPPLGTVLVELAACISGQPTAVIAC